MKAQDIMTLGVVSVQSNASVMRAVQLMLQNEISGLPVVDDKGSLVGIVTEGDFLRRGELGTQRKRPRWLEFLVGPGRLAEEYVHACGRKVDEIMTPEPYTVSVDTPVDEIVRLMEKHRIKRLPVVENGKPVGMVSRANLLAALARAGREVTAPTTERRGDLGADIGGVRQATLGVQDQCHCQKWHCGASGRDHRRTRASGFHRRGRKCARREGRARSPCVG